MAYDGERLARSTLLWLQSDLGSNLDTVEATWAGTDPVTLPDPVTWHKGHKPTVVELASTAFPFVCVIVVERKPEHGAEWGFQSREIALFIEYYVVANDEETVDKIASRYAEAIIALLQSGRIVEGFQQVNWEPSVHFSEVLRHPVSTEADMMDATDEDFLKAGRVEVVFTKS